MAQIWNAAERRDLINGCEEEERFCGALRKSQSFYKSSSRGRASRKMNSFILLSLFATIIAGKSPRLKFVVHGRQRCIFWILFDFFFFITNHSANFSCHQACCIILCYVHGN